MRSRLAERIFGPESTLANPSWLAVLAGAALSALGVYAIAHATAPMDADDAPASLSTLALRQAAYIGAGVLAGLMVALPHSRHVRLASWPVMGVVIGLLVFLLLPGVPAWLVTPRNGTRGWINLGPVDFQPAELAKIAFVLVAADYLRYRRNHRTWLGLVPPAVITFVPVALITLQPDLGSAMMFLPAIFAILLAAGAKLRHLTVVVLAGALAGPAAYPLLKPHQKQRIIGLIRQVQGDTASASDINYQAFTALRLAGAGEVAGLSREHSRALIRFNVLPERHNDMILAVILNRFGLAGGLATMGLYTLWIAGALLTAATTKDPFGRLVAVGCAALVSAQALVNVGMNLGILPIVGLTLPFVSYGGSSMVAAWVMTGLLVGIGARKASRLQRHTFEFDDDA